MQSTIDRGFQGTSRPGPFSLRSLPLSPPAMHQPCPPLTVTGAQHPPPLLLQPLCCFPFCPELSLGLGGPPLMSPPPGRMSRSVPLLPLVLLLLFYGSGVCLLPRCKLCVGMSGSQKGTKMTQAQILSLRSLEARRTQGSIPPFVLRSPHFVIHFTF